MALNSISPGLRTIHNGSNAVAKATVVVQVGDELTVSDDVAAQLKRDPSFKDGPTPAKKAAGKSAANKKS